MGQAGVVRTLLFDFDGTVVDSDAALLAPFAALGVPEGSVPPLGLPLGRACELAGIAVDDYLAHYDPTVAEPFPGILEVLHGLDRWGVASNKDRATGLRELGRLGLAPAAAFFSDDFGGGPKALGPLLAAMELDGEEAVYVGDTHHDRACALAVGATFALAGWNQRAEAQPGDVVLTTPTELLDLLAG